MSWSSAKGMTTGTAISCPLPYSILTAWIYLFLLAGLYTRLFSLPMNMDMVTVSVRIYQILFYFERGLHSRTEIGEREINGITVHSIGAVGNRTLFSSLPLPPPLFTT
jgi:hypothetical protein